MEYEELWKLTAMLKGQFTLATPNLSPDSSNSNPRCLEGKNNRHFEAGLCSGVIHRMRDE